MWNTELASSNPTRWESRSLGVSPQVRTILNSVLVTSLVLVGLNTPSHAPIALELATFTKVDTNPSLAN